MITKISHLFTDDEIKFRQDMSFFVKVYRNLKPGFSRGRCTFEISHYEPDYAGDSRRVTHIFHLWYISFVLSL